MAMTLEILTVKFARLLCTSDVSSLQELETQWMIWKQGWLNALRWGSAYSANSLMYEWLLWLAFWINAQICIICLQRAGLTKLKKPKLMYVPTGDLNTSWCNLQCRSLEVTWSALLFLNWTPISDDTQGRVHLIMMMQPGHSGVASCTQMDQKTEKHIWNVNKDPYLWLIGFSARPECINVKIMDLLVFNHGMNSSFSDRAFFLQAGS